MVNPGGGRQAAVPRSSQCTWPQPGCSCSRFLARQSHGRATRETCLSPCLSPWQPLPGLTVTQGSEQRAHSEASEVCCLLRFFLFPLLGHLLPLPSVTTVQPFPTTKTDDNDWCEFGKQAFTWFAVGYSVATVNLLDTDTSGATPNPLHRNLHFIKIPR